LKAAKGHYLLKIAETMSICNIERSIYEPLGIAKLRTICKLDPVKDYNNVDGAVIINDLIKVAMDVSIESLKESIDNVQGKTGDDQECWLNVAMTRAARDKVVSLRLKRCRR